MKQLSIFLFLGLVLSLGGCDCTFDYTYIVDNDSTSPITVQFTQQSRSASVWIDAEESKTLLTTDNGVEDCDGPHQSDIDNMFESITVLQDSIPSTLIYLDNANWRYSNGTYRATVTDEEFE